MKSDYSNKILQSSKLNAFHQSISLQTLRTPRPILSRSPENDRIVHKSKVLSPNGHMDWSDEVTPKGSIQIHTSIKLPPIDSDVKKIPLSEAPKNPSKNPQPEKSIFKARGSILLESSLALATSSTPASIPSDSHCKSISQPLIPAYYEEFKQRLSVKPVNSPPSLHQTLESVENLKVLSKNTIKPKESPRFPNVITRCGYKTHTGSVQGKHKKHNQDNWIISQKVQGLKGQYLLAVCDGHGEKGHKVSALIKQHLTLKVEESLSSCLSPSDNINDYFAQGIRCTVTAVEESGLDLNFSGSTLAALLICGRKAIIANIGDSRVVLGSRDSQGRWQATDLSSDQKPCRADEAARVMNAGGVVRQFQNGSGESAGPLRVWSKERNAPGLAMTRSIGDVASKKNGIISEPEITARTLRGEDKFLILATDGVWDFISSQEAVDIVKEVWALGKSEACCEKLLVEAKRRWEGEGVVDDITILVAFINVKNH